MRYLVDFHVYRRYAKKWQSDDYRIHTLHKLIVGKQYICKGKYERTRISQ